MVLDGHIHIMDKSSNDYGSMVNKMYSIGIDGGIILSLPPKSFGEKYDSTFEERIDNLFKCTSFSDKLYPFFWIDPMEEDAKEQVEKANERGVLGYKVICNRFYPGDDKALDIFRLIAKSNKPILFHSGILWDGYPSSKYNRPGEFEALLEVDGLKFALAHISWPWCDENIAVYGKFLNAYTRRPDLSVEMFIDITPGTPPIYREEVLTKLFTVGYDVENNVMFGSDSVTHNYNSGWTKQWIDRDNTIYEKLGIGEELKERIYCRNLLRFIGLTNDKVDRKILRAGE